MGVWTVLHWFWVRGQEENIFDVNIIDQEGRYWKSWSDYKDFELWRWLNKEKYIDISTKSKVRDFYSNVIELCEEKARISPLNWSIVVLVFSCIWGIFSQLYDVTILIPLIFLWGAGLVVMRGIIWKFYSFYYGENLKFRELKEVFLRLRLNHDNFIKFKS